MAIDFPNSPTLNQQYTVGDRSWTWNGTFWQVTGTTSTFTASDSAPSGPSIGDFWFESDTGKTFVYYDDVWVEVGSASGSIDAGNLAGSTLASSVVNSSLTNVTSSGFTVRTASTQDGVALAGRAGGTGTYEVTLTPTTLTADRTLTLPNSTGTVATTTDVGLVPITPSSVAGTGVSLSGNVVSFSTATSISINGCFSSSYDCYRVVLSITNTSNSTGYIRYRNRLNGSDSQSSYTSIGETYYVSAGTQNTNTGVGTGNQAVSSGICGYSATGSASGGMVFDIFNPFLSNYTTLAWQGSARNNDSGLEGGSGTSIHYVVSSYDGFTIFPTYNNMTGKLVVYGYRF